MACYSYRCPERHEFEQEFKIGEAPQEVPCQVCGERALRVFNTEVHFVIPPYMRSLDSEGDERQKAFLASDKFKKWLDNFEKKANAEPSRWDLRFGRACDFEDDSQREKWRTRVKKEVTELTARKKDKVI